MKLTNFTRGTLGVLVAGGIAWGCSSKSSDCTANKDCAEFDGGAAGFSGTPGSSGKSGSAGSSGSSGKGGGAVLGNDGGSVGAEGGSSGVGGGGSGTS
ncbi:MAG: hypothetical protein ABI548_13110, partial [Polyangiaceae bacterium]